MGKFECKSCGGSLAPLEGSELYICEYCGTRQPVSSVDEEKIISLYNRANKLRLKADFDRAYDIYEKIIDERAEEAEAYWGQCLCKFGIGYVKDPATGEYKPTVHRASFDKLRKDALYELALDYADEAAQLYYQREAKEIDRIMGEILSISRNEAPYDVFICYKEADEFKNRTPDSVIAQDIYTALTEKGYKVFFARITLKEKLGQQFEPYIFAALNSARLMLTVGTDYEYFNAAWVKNEWSRFLKLMAADKSKLLVPCFKNMEPEDLPDEIKGLESQNMGVLGAMQDLLLFIDKFFGRSGSPVPAQAQAGTAAANNGGLKEIALADGGLYTGEAVAEKPHGQGKAIYPDGTPYTGEWAFGKYNGQGTYTYSDGETWSGEWKNGEKLTGSGKVVYYKDGKPNGNYYTGEYKDGKCNGQGTINWASGDSYTGEWKDDRCSGQGTKTYADGTTWTGEWKDSEEWTGSGKVVYYKDGKPDGYYVGEYKDGKRNGQGTYTYANGNSYTGEWKDGNKDGQGTFTWADGGRYSGDRYTGEWKDDKKDGQGTYSWANGDSYTGEWKDGKRNGQGTYTYADGTTWTGEWKDSKEWTGSGKVTYTYKGKPDGYYTGEYKDGKRSGQGTYTHTDGRTWVGIWKDGEPYTGNGTWKGITGRFRNGKKTFFG